MPFSREEEIFVRRTLAIFRSFFTKLYFFIKNLIIGIFSGVFIFSSNTYNFPGRPSNRHFINRSCNVGCFPFTFMKLTTCTTKLYKEEKLLKIFLTCSNLHIDTRSLYMLCQDIFFKISGCFYVCCSVFVPFWISLELVLTKLLVVSDTGQCLLDYWAEEMSFWNTSCACSVVFVVLRYLITQFRMLYFYFWFLIFSKMCFWISCSLFFKTTTSDGFPFANDD